MNTRPRFDPGPFLSGENGMTESVNLTAAEATDLIARALRASDVSPANALSVAKALVAAEIDGQSGHGFSRVAAYAAQAASGKVSGHAAPVVTAPRTALLHVDAGNGFAFPAIDAAINRLVVLAPETGIAGAMISKSHHAGQIGAHVERLAANGLIALMFANSPKAMAPWGGSSPLFGTNPIAFAAHREGAAPLVIDLSLSKVARGKVMAANQRGEAIPEGWALDEHGVPTTDAAAALKGSMIPAGEAKGAALALLVEILAASLTGANHSFKASSFFDAEGPPPGVGQMIIAIDAGASAGFADRLTTLLNAITGQEGTRLPGESRFARRKKATSKGLLMPQDLHNKLSSMAA
jgi:(2R)-3-sulfolactate dehydrogenase (NADP+)